MIYIRTTAYNAEKVISRTIDSVLGQTHTEFLYFICDNGSTDSTGRIIREYATNDSRIRICANKRNRIWETDTKTLEFVNLPHTMRKEDYYCALDADDEYLPSFLEDMLRFIREHNLDIACCGSYWIDSSNNQVFGERKIPKDMILSNGDFSSHFPVYFQFMRPVWGKLYTGTTLKTYSIGAYNKEPGVPYYGSDTVQVMRAFQCAQRVGILAKSLHRYYLSQKSISYTMDNHRINDDRLLYDKITDFLTNINAVTDRNSEFLFLVYMNAIKDTLSILLSADTSESKKIAGVIDIFSHEYTKQLAAHPNFGALNGDAPGQTKQRRALFSAATNWLLTREEVPDEQIEQFCATGEFVSAACENAGGWLFFKKLLARFLLDADRADEARLKIDELAELLPDDGEVLAMRDEIEYYTL